MSMNLLLVESSRAQALRIFQPLLEAGVEATWTWAGTAEDFRAALDGGGWDALICAQAVPGFAYPAALAEVQARGLALPVIVVGPKGDEEVVARALRLGARDFVSMGRLTRLVQAVQRETGRSTLPPAPPRPSQGGESDVLEYMDEAYALMEVVPEAPGRPEDLRVIAMNRAFERVSGLDAATAPGRTLRELVPGFDGAWIARLGQVAATGQPLVVDSYLSRHGHTFSGLAFAQGPGRFAVLFSDITESLALASKGESLSAAVDNTPDGVFTIDLEGRIIYANPALERLLGLEPGASNGQALGGLLPGLPIAEGDPAQPWQGRLPLEGGQVLDCTLTPVRDMLGLPTSRVGLVRDVTREVETERSLRQMEKMKALKEVAGGVSHDFNNLLTAILSAAELIEWQLSADSPIRHKLQVIYQAVMRARELNRQIRAFSRQAEEKFAPVDFSAVFKEAVLLIRSTFPVNIRFGTRLSPGIWVNGNASQLHQIIMNLAINAMQAMPPGGGSLDIALEDREGSAVLTVRDTGRGMDEATLERIFEPFFSTRERSEGRGLGLSVVHGIVQAHGGTISVKSAPGQGSTFTVAMPCTVRLEAEPASPTQSDCAGTERILFVDDEEVLSALGKQGLQMLGYHVTARSDAGEALEEFAKHAPEYDLMITDLSMPGLSGVELTQRIHKIRPEVPVILITGAFQDPLPLEGMSTPFAQVLLKPVSILELAQAARRVLNQRPAPAPAAESSGDAERGPAGTAILLAEDSTTTRSLLRSWLVKAGYTVDEARDGQEAWEALERSRGRYAMLVTDVVMPRMDGLQLAARTRKLDPSLPILMLSSSEDTESVKEALHLHVNDFLTKPFESRVLVETVERLSADQAARARTQRSVETAQAVRMAQRAMEAAPEKDMPVYSISEPLTDAGGDVFRAFRRTDGSVFFTLADVAGHSVISSYAVAAYLGMLANFLTEESDLRALALKVNRSIQAGPFSEAPICALFGHWTPAIGRIHLLAAGIPHPIWYRAGRGATRPVQLNGTPLGILDDPLVEEKVLVLGEGDRLLFGSDGFFDAASSGKPSFHELACPIWGGLGSTDILQAVNEVSEAARIHAGGRFEDDLLVVALEQPPAEEIPSRFHRILPSDPRCIDEACEALATFLDARNGEDPSRERRYDTLLAVREGLSNAMFHGNAHDPSATVDLAARFEEDGLHVAIVDEGPGFDAQAHVPPDTGNSERGRGIPLIRHFSRHAAMTGGELTMIFDR